MAENDKAAEREHQATSKRLTEMHKLGQIARSRDLTSGIIFLTGILLVISLSQHLSIRLEENFRVAFESIKTVMTDEGCPGVVIHSLILSTVLIIIPMILALFFSVFLSPFLFGGWNFSLHALLPKFHHLDVMQNLGRIFSSHSLIEIVKSFTKFLFITGSLVIFILANKDRIMHVSHLAIKPAMSEVFSLLKLFIINVSCALVIVVIFDIALAFYRFKRQSMMTTQEIKEESKETDGHPDMKRKIRSRQLSIIRQRLSQSVPQANVIITNPTHYAIALQYREKKDRAPKVIAKGKGFVAEQIRNLAILNAVPIYQAPLLARALYHTTNINSEVHPELYMSVAIVLSYIHQLRNFQKGIGKLPQMVSDLKIPADFVYEE